MEFKLIIVGLQEVMRDGEKLLITKEGNLFYYVGTNRG